MVQVKKSYVEMASIIGHTRRSIYSNSLVLVGSVEACTVAPFSCLQLIWSISADLVLDEDCVVLCYKLNVIE